VSGPASTPASVSNVFGDEGWRGGPRLGTIRPPPSCASCCTGLGTSAGQTGSPCELRIRLRPFGNRWWQQAQQASSLSPETQHTQTSQRAGVTIERHGSEHVRKQHMADRRAGGGEDPLGKSRCHPSSPHPACRAKCEAGRSDFVCTWMCATMSVRLCLCARARVQLQMTTRQKTTASDSSMGPDCSMGRPGVVGSPVMLWKGTASGTTPVVCKTSGNATPISRGS
jgi:hypothetical protein